MLAQHQNQAPETQLKSTPRDTIADLLTSLPSIADILGLQPRRGMACCPFHGEKKPSFSIRRSNGRERYRCFSCGVKGDAIDALAFVKKTSPAEVLRELRQRAGKPLRIPRMRRSAAPRPAPIRDLNREIEGAINTCSPRARAFLEERFPGLVERILINDLVADPHKLRFEGVKSRIAQGFELFVPTRSLEQPDTFSGGHYRFTDPGAPPDKLAKSLSLHGSAGGRYGAVYGHVGMAIEAARRNYGALSEDLSETFGAPVLVLAEGEMDLISTFISLDLLACLGVAGAAEAPRVASFFREQTDFEGFLLLALHGDQAGRDATEAARKVLIGQSRIRLLDLQLPGVIKEVEEVKEGIARKVQKLVKIEDLNDILTNRGSYALGTRLMNAVELNLRPAEQPTESKVDGCPSEAAAAIKSARQSRMTEAQRATLVEFGKAHPYDAHRPGLAKGGRQASCAMNFYAKVIYDRTKNEVGLRGAQCRYCEQISCPGCRGALIDANKGNIERWGLLPTSSKSAEPLAIYRFKTEGDFETLKKVRAKVGSKTDKLRKTLGLESHGLLKVFNPWLFEVFACGPQQLLDELAKVTGDKGELIPRDQLHDRVRTSLMRFPEYFMAMFDKGDIQAIEEDRWMNSSFHQLSRSGLLLPFETSSRPQAHEEDQPEDPDIIELGSAVFSKRGLISLTARKLNNSNMARIGLDQEERLWQDANLARIFANVPELLGERLKAVMEQLAALVGGLDPRIVSEHWWGDLSSFARDEARRRVTELEHQLSDAHDRGSSKVA